MLYITRKNDEEIVITLPNKKKIVIGCRIIGNKVQFFFDNKWVNVQDKK